MKTRVQWIQRCTTFSSLSFVITAVMALTSVGLVAAEESSAPATKPRDGSPANDSANGLPRIVSTAPVAGAKDVDPGTSEIVVVFDRDMGPGCSWTGGGSSYPPFPEGQRAHWRDSRTAVLPVKLEPARFYRVGINSKNHKGFRSAAGIPAWPSVVYFTTFGASDELIAKTRKPAIVDMSPANGATNVDPRTTELRVTFDVPMGAGFSWTGGGLDFPPAPESQRPHWSEDELTCVLPVHLEPNHVYRLGLNSISHNNFKSAAGVPLDPVIYTFRTGW